MILTKNEFDNWFMNTESGWKFREIFEITDRENISRANYITDMYAMLNEDAKEEVTNIVRDQ